jgi:alkaline phosphatase
MKHRTGHLFKRGTTYYLRYVVNGKVHQQALFHPDGTGLNHWNALRTLTKGPDGALEWDALPGMAVYSGHMSDALAGTSNGGATVHAYGVKVAARSFGLDGETPIVAASGKPASIVQEALASGRATGLVQTGHIAEPGTAAFIASVKKRNQYTEIARQVVQSGVPVILGGGEAMLLPKGVAGRHGDGMREDGLDLIQWAKGSGYTVVYTRQELAALDLSKVDKLLGVFARWNTFSDKTEEENAREGLGHYLSSAPTVAEMSSAALQILSRSKDGFLLVVEEEGTDNMANNNNASGTLEALRRADEAVGVLHRHVKDNPNTLLLMAADSDAGGMQLIGPGPGREMEPGKPLPATSKNGSPADGVTGTGGVPFLSAPDAKGQRWPFAITWATENDVHGGILVRAAGKNADKVKGRLDNTDIYKIMYQTLFDRPIGN